MKVKTLEFKGCGYMKFSNIMHEHTMDGQNTNNQQEKMLPTTNMCMYVCVGGGGGRGTV